MTLNNKGSVVSIHGQNRRMKTRRESYATKIVVNTTLVGYNWIEGERARAA